jgi:YfiH family protein
MSAAASPALHPDWIVPAWPVPPGVRAFVTTRAGGVSRGPWSAGDAGGGMNLGLGADDPADVQDNRARLSALLPRAPCWLQQVHGTVVVDAASVSAGAVADAAVAVQPGAVCCVLVADCLPVLLADAQGRGVAVAHAGWRGLSGGVIQGTVSALRRAIGDADARLLAFLGPAIGPSHFEVGPEVLAAMRQRLPRAGDAFVDAGAGKFRADLFALARQALEQVHVHGAAVSGGAWCTASDRSRFFSYRRDRVTGRHAAVIWLES